MKSLFVFVFALSVLCAGAAELILTPTFHSCSVYFRVQKMPKCTVLYREKGSSQWLPAFEPQYDSSYHSQYRTSIVDLKADTIYEVKAEAASARRKITKTGTFRTWADQVPIAKTVVLTAQQVKNGYTIRAKGKPDGWIRYTTAPGVVVNGGSNRQALLLDQCEYVIVENMVIRGGRYNAVNLNECKYVRLRNLDISQWGDAKSWKFDRKTGRYRSARGSTLHNQNAIYLHFGYGQVIERCYIHDPVLSSNEWRYGHPDGPQGIAPKKPRRTVIRYNDICGSDLKWWNDGIAGNHNFDADGGLNQDCDVYGNYIAFANDDAIELDGGQQNVRCFRNIFENCFMGMSIQGCITGPSFLFENLCNDFGSEFMQVASGLKTADTWAGIRAASFIYNNTFNVQTTIGICSRFRMVVKNNILNSFRLPAQSFSFTRTEHSNNLLQTKPLKKNIFGKAVYTDPERGIYTLKANSPGKGKAVAIPGLNKVNKDMGVPASLELPFRPFGLSLPQGRRAAFTVKNGRAFPAMQTLTLKATAPVEFTVRKSADSDWYSVIPSKGKMKAGQTMKIRIKLHPEKMKSRINYRSAFFLRSKDGFSRPVGVRAQTDHKYKGLGEYKNVFRYTFGAPFRKLSGGGVRMDERSKKKVRIEFELKKDAHVTFYFLARDCSKINYGAVSMGVDTEELTRCAMTGSYWMPKLSKEKFNYIRTKSLPLKKGKHFIIIQPRKSVDLKELCIVEDDVTITEFR